MKEHQLVDAIAAELRDGSALSARDLASRTGADKTDINRILYRWANRFIQCGGTPPYWRLVVESSPPRIAMTLKLLEGSAPVEAEANVSASQTHAAKSHDRAEARLPTLLPWQEEALDAWRASGYRGVVEAVTGTGKTMLGLAAVAQEIRRKGKALILVPTIELQRQWVGQLHKHLPNARIATMGTGNWLGNEPMYGHDAVVAVVNSARTAQLDPPRGKGLLVADECHRYGAAVNAQALKTTFQRRLGLSATYERNDEGKEDWLDPYFGGTCYSIGYERAVPEGIVARFTVTLIGASFTEEERQQYDTFSEEAHRAKKTLVERFGAPEQPFGEFMKEVERLRRSGDRRASITASRFLKAFSDRRKLLAQTPVKYDTLREIVPAISAANGALVFTQTVDGAEIAARLLRSEGVSAAAIHSGMNHTERRTTLAAFPAQLKAIVAPQVLDEGVDVPDADLAIIMASSRTRRQMIQRMGRVLRRKSDGRYARFAILYIEDTSEDPATGAHEAFLDDLSSVCEVMLRFRMSEAAEACALLCATDLSQLKVCLPLDQLALESSPLSGLAITDVTQTLYPGTANHLWSLVIRLRSGEGTPAIETADHLRLYALMFGYWAAVAEGSCELENFTAYRAFRAMEQLMRSRGDLDPEGQLRFEYDDNGYFYSV